MDRGLRSIARAALAGSILFVSVSASAQGPAPDCRIAKLDAAGTARPGVEVGAEQKVALEGTARERFMMGDTRGALEAWNQAGRPRVLCIKPDGLVRTGSWIVIRYMDLDAGELFNPGKFSRTERRLDELPFTSRTRLRYDPLPDGTAIISPILRERDLMPMGIGGWGVVAARAVFIQEVRVDFVSPTGRGEVWSPSFRFHANRPRVMLRFEAPAPGPLPGIAGFHGFIERQSFQYPILGEDVVKQGRQRVGATLGDWITSWLRWEAGAAFDRIAGSSAFAFSGGLNARAMGDRVAVILSSERWSGADERAAFTNSEFVVMTRTTATPDTPVFTVTAGVARAGDATPILIWPGATSGDGRTALLRAHSLRRTGVVTGEALGRGLVFMSAEYERPMHSPIGMIGLAGFIDTAQASRGIDPADPTSRLHADIGVGVRFQTSGTGKVRLDLGYGLRDGRVELSAGFGLPWGRR